VDDIIFFVGLDVHKATVSVAVAEAGRGGEVRHVGVVANRPDHIGKLVERLAKSGRRLSFCYEAGPCGYGLYRQLTGLGHTCLVVAPSLIPMKAGDRVKTDRRDAVMLAKLHRAGELSAVWVPVRGCHSGGCCHTGGCAGWNGGIARGAWSCATAAVIHSPVASDRTSGLKSASC
jgi:transposase